jgi:hypothetical protein
LAAPLVGRGLVPLLPQCPGCSVAVRGGVEMGTNGLAKALGPRQ